MRTVRLVVGFQGTRYEGWQSQLKGTSIQEILEKHLARILKEKVGVTGSSRTDSGVHALALVAHFRTKSALADRSIQDALNYYLPHDILVRSAKTVPADFHARYRAKSKIYRYDIWNSRTRPLFEAPFVLWHPRPLNVRLMKQASKYLIGKHDFAAFKDGKDEKESTVRIIKRLAIQKQGPLIRITIQGNGFLRHMVRVIVGTLIEAGRKRLSPSELSNILHSKDRRLAGPTAKSLGLSLVSVQY